MTARQDNDALFRVLCECGSIPSLSFREAEEVLARLSRALIQGEMKPEQRGLSNAGLRRAGYWLSVLQSYLGADSLGPFVAAARRYIADRPGGAGGPAPFVFWMQDSRQPAEWDEAAREWGVSRGFDVVRLRRNVTPRVVAR